MTPAEVMAGIYSRYWPADSPAHVIQTEIIRHASQLELIRARVPHGGRIVDVGCGWGAFAAGCASLGYRVTMVDDHGDAGFADATDLRHRIPADFDISAVRFNAVRDPWPFPADSLDAVTTFDSMEHWHDSPKRLFGDIARSLKPGGWLVIGVPNAANLKKRIEALIGVTEWSSMGEWYERDAFRGHVREPTVRDLRYIAASLGLVDVTVHGYNWLGRANPSRIVAAATPVVDGLLRMRPTLCSDIYMTGRKP